MVSIVRRSINYSKLIYYFPYLHTFPLGWEGVCVIDKVTIHVWMVCTLIQTDFVNVTNDMIEHFQSRRLSIE